MSHLNPFFLLNHHKSLKNEEMCLSTTPLILISLIFIYFFHVSYPCANDCI
jgi:hypothetical protein